jgi:hypothetical protein
MILRPRTTDASSRLTHDNWQLRSTSNWILVYPGGVAIDQKAVESSGAELVLPPAPSQPEPSAGGTRNLKIKYRKEIIYFRYSLGHFN